MDTTLNQDAVAEIWRPVVLTFESACSFDNPFLDVEIWAEFVGPSGRVIRREAYWDGDRTYRVSFAPTELGAWNYGIEAPEQTGLNGRVGSVEAVPYTGDLDLYRHGFIRVADNPRLFAYSDGTPFFLARRHPLGVCLPRELGQVEPPWHDESVPRHGRPACQAGIYRLPDQLAL